MGERQKGKEIIGKGEIYFLSHPGKEEIFSGYGLTVEEGSKGNLVGVLMVDRPRPVDQEWLNLIERNFGEYQLVPMTATGERGIVCRMKIESESLHYLRQYSADKAGALKKALEPLLDDPPEPKFILGWDEDVNLWQSHIASVNENS